MIEEIKFVVFNPNYQIGITQKNKAYVIRDNKALLCKKTVHMGSIHYQIPQTNIKISEKQIYKNHIKNYVVQHYCPF